jgi:hypothetical protein
VAHLTIENQVREFTTSRPLLIAKPLNRYRKTHSVTGLPRHNDLHWRGLWQPCAGDVHGRFGVDDRLLPSVPANSRKSEFQPFEEAVLCHCKPLDGSAEPAGSESRYADIPDRLDIYLLLRHQFNTIAFAGKTIAAIIRRTPDTYPLMLRLRDWEADRDGGRYRRSRGRSQLRRALKREPTLVEVERQHATSALRALGLRWPDKPRNRHKKWVECLHELSLIVETSHDLRPILHRATSTEMQKALIEKRRRERSTGSNADYHQS